MKQFWEDVKFILTVLYCIAVDRLFFGPAPSEHREKGNDANDRGRGE